MHVCLGLLMFGAANPAVQRQAKEDTILGEVKLITEKFKIDTKIAATFRTKLQTLSTSVLSQAQEEKYRKYIEWGLYSRVLQEALEDTSKFVGAGGETMLWSVAADNNNDSVEKILTGYLAAMGLSAEEPTTHAGWTERLRETYAHHSIMSKEAAETLVGQGRLMSKADFMTKIDQLVNERLDFEFVDGAGFTDDSVPLEVVGRLWLNLRNLLFISSTGTVFGKGQKAKLQALIAKTEKEIPFSERIASLSRITVSGRLNYEASRADFNEESINSFVVRATRMVAALDRTVTKEERHLAKNEVQRYIDINSIAMTNEQLKVDLAARYSQLLDMLSRNVIASELFDDEGVYAFRYRESPTAAPKYLQVVEGKNLMVTGETMADLSTHFTAQVPETGDRVCLKIFLKGTESVDKNSSGAAAKFIQAGGPVTFEEATLPASSSYWGQRFIPEVDENEVLSLLSANDSDGYISIDSKKVLRTKAPLTLERSGVVKDGKLTSVKWSKFELEKVPAFYVRLGNVRKKSDSDRLAQYSNIAMELAVLQGATGVEARLAFVEEIDNWLEEKKDTKASWQSFMSTHLTNVSAMIETSKSLFGQFLETELNLKTGIAELEISLTTPPDVLERRADMPFEGSLFAIKANGSNKFLRVVKDDLGGDEFYLKADADDPLDPACHIKAVTYKGKLGFASRAAGGKRLQEPELGADLVEETSIARSLGAKARDRKTRLSFSSGITSSDGVEISFKSPYNVREQFRITGVLDGDSYAFENFSYPGALLTVDDEGFARIRSWQADAIKVVSKGGVDAKTGTPANSAQSFDIIPLTPFHEELGKVRALQDDSIKLDKYSSLLAFIETDDDSLWLITEIYNYILTKKETKKLWNEFTKDSNYSSKVEKLLESIGNIISTGAVDSLARLTGLWQSPFTGKLADGSIVVLSWTDANGDESFVQVVEDEDENENVIFVCKANGKDKMNQIAHLKAQVTQNSKIIFSSAYIPEDAKAAVGTLWTKDEKTPEQAKGIPGVALFGAAPSFPNDDVKFQMVGPEEGAGFKSVKTGSFLSVSAIDFSLSTLDPVLGNPTGVERDGRYYPSVRETFRINVLSDYEKTLAGLRVPDVAHADRIAGFLALADRAQEDSDKELIIAEVDRWIRITRASSDWESVKDDSTGMPRIVDSLILSIAKIAVSAQAKSRVERISKMWTGISGEVIPTNEQAIAISVTINGEDKFLQVVKEEEAGQSVYFLAAVATNPVDSSTQFKIIWKNDTLGLVSEFAENNRLSVPVLADDAGYWAAAARSRGSRLQLIEPLKSKRGKEIKFTSDQNLTDHFLLEETTDQNVFKIRNGLFHLAGARNQEGYLRVDEDGFVRAVDYDQLVPLDGSTAVSFEFLVITPFHADLNVARSKIGVDRINLYESLIVRAKSEDDIVLLMGEIGDFISAQKETEEKWNLFTGNKALNDAANNLINKMKDIFVAELATAGSSVKIALDALAKNITTPFAELLTNNSRVVLKWTDKDGKKFFVRLVEEIFFKGSWIPTSEVEPSQRNEKETLRYIFKADGEDLLDPAAGLKVNILEGGGVELQTRLFGDVVEEVVTTPEKDENKPQAFNEKIEIKVEKKGPEPSLASSVIDSAASSFRKVFGTAASIMAAVFVQSMYAPSISEELAAQASAAAQASSSISADVWKLRVMENLAGGIRGERIIAEFKQYDSANSKPFVFLGEGSRISAALKSDITQGFLSVGKSDQCLSTIDEMTGKPAGVIRAGVLTPSSWETFEIIELAEYALLLIDLRKLTAGQDNNRARVSQYISAVELAKTPNDKELIIAEVLHWVGELKKTEAGWREASGDELVSKFVMQLILSLNPLAQTAELKAKVADIATDWDEGFIGVSPEGAPKDGSMVALLSIVEEGYYVKLSPSGDSANPWKVELSRDAAGAVVGSIGKGSLKSAFGIKNDEGDKQFNALFVNEITVGDNVGTGAWKKRVKVKRFLKVEKNRSLNDSFVLRAGFESDPTAKYPRYDHPFDSVAQFKLLSKGNRVGFQSATAAGNNLRTEKIEDTSGWIARKKENETCAQFKEASFAALGDNPEHFVMTGTKEQAIFYSVGAKGYLSVALDDHFARVLDPATPSGTPMGSLVSDPNSVRESEIFQIVEIGQFHNTVMAARAEKDYKTRIKLLGDAIYAVQTNSDLGLLIGEFERFYDEQGKSKVAWSKFKSDSSLFNNFKELLAHERFSGNDVTPDLKIRIDVLEKMPLPSFAVQGAEEEVLTFSERHAKSAEALELMSPQASLPEEVLNWKNIANSRSEPRVYDYKVIEPSQEGGDYAFIVGASKAYLADATDLEKKYGVVLPLKKEADAYRTFLESRVLYNRVVMDGGKQKEIEELVAMLEKSITYAERVEHLGDMLGNSVFSAERKMLFISHLKAIASRVLLEQARDEEYDLKKAKKICRIAMANQFTGGEATPGFDFVKTIKDLVKRLEYPILSPSEFIELIKSESEALAPSVRMDEFKREERLQKLVDMINNWKNSYLFTDREYFVSDKRNMKDWEVWRNAQSDSVLIGTLRSNLNGLSTRLKTIVRTVFRRYPEMKEEISKVSTEVAQVSRDLTRRKRDGAS
jgi:hypothetical protein